MTIRSHFGSRLSLPFSCVTLAVPGVGAGRPAPPDHNRLWLNQLKLHCDASLPWCAFPPSYGELDTSALLFLADYFCQFLAHCR